MLPSAALAGYKTTFSPNISINEEYTGNVFYTNEDTEEDFVTVVSPGFDLEVDGKNKGVTVSYSPAASFYARNSENDTLRHDASVNGWIDVTRNARIELFDTFRRTEQPIALADEEPSPADLAVPAEVDTTRRRGLEPYYTNTIGINWSQRIGKTDEFTMGYAYSILENEDPEVQDNARHSPTIGYSHQFSQFMDAQVNFDYERGEFSGDSDNFDNWSGGLTLTRQFTKRFAGNIRYNHTIMDFRGDTEDYRIYDPSVGVGYTLGEDLTLAVNVGYFVQDRQQSDDETGLSIDGNIGKTWQFRRGSIDLSGSSGYGESYFGAENLGFNTFYQGEGSGSYSFTKSFRGRIFGSYRETDYVNSADDRTDQISTAGIGFTYDPLTIDWLSCSLTYTYRRMDSTIDENDYEEDRVLLNFNLIPSKTIRFD